MKFTRLEDSWLWVSLIVAGVAVVGLRTKNSRGGRAPLFALSVLLMWPSLTLAAGIQALFNLEGPAGGPFPSNRFTVADRSENTRRRVNLPYPDCDARPSDCADLDVINTLDGFNLQPRLTIPFDGPIDINTVTSETVFLVNLGSTMPGGPLAGKIIGINQVVWDPDSNTLYVESDEFLDQHTRYVLIVTRGVRDLAGDPVEASEAFKRFRRDLTFDEARDPDLKAYGQALHEALEEARKDGIALTDIVAASVFTTESATAILEKIRDQIKAATPAPADFILGIGAIRTVFPLTAVQGIKFNRQIRTAPPGDFRTSDVPVVALGIIPGAVGEIAFGEYLSPDYETAEKFIPPVGTRLGTPQVQEMNKVFFNLFLPSGPKPTDGWPVAIFGHGFGDNKNNSPFAVAAIMAARGIATIAINVVGHGGGPLGTLTVSQDVGEAVTLFAGGRGIDQNGDGRIDSTEGVSAAPPRQIIDSRDGLRQTVVDLMQLVRLIEVGVDVDGDGVPDLDPSRIYYFGQSFGGIYGTIFLGVEPDVRAGVPNVPGGPVIDVARLSPVFRPVVGIAIASRVPSLLNADGVTSIGGVPVSPPHFNENLPLRGLPPVINSVPGAIEIQEVIENTEWVSQSGNPVAYARHIQKDPLGGMPAKAVIVQFARGDRTVPNPTATAILRAGDLAESATFFRNDLAFAENPDFPRNPHTFLTNININFPAVAAVALGAQGQIAEFFASDGKVVIHPEPQRFFEVPIVLPLPEDFGYIPPAGMEANQQGLTVLDANGKPVRIEWDDIGGCTSWTMLCGTVPRSPKP